MVGPARWLAAGALLLAAAALFPTAPLSWGGAEAPDGTRFKVSLVGLSHVLEPRRSVSPTRNCRWTPAGGDAELCRVRPGGEAAFARLRAAYPSLWLAVALCVGAAGVTLVPRASLRARWGLALAGAAAPAGIMLLFATSAGSALQVLSSVPFGLAATRATMQAMLAVLLGLFAAGLQAAPRPHPAVAAGAVVLSAAAPFIGLRFGGWGGAAAGFLLSALVLLAPPRRTRVAG